MVGSLYKLCNNSQRTTAQKSQLGVDCGPVVVSAIGLADDTICISDDIFKLAGLVHLASEYCSAYHVTLVPEKTKLICFTPANQEVNTLLAEICNPISVAGQPIPFTDTAEHVGILRTVSGGNMPHILGRISAHTRALQGVLHCGLARGHRGNTASALRLERMYGAPVLMSGVAALVLSSPELAALHQHFKVTIVRLLRLPQNTPESFVMLLAGSLPLTGLLHLAMLTLLGMVARLGASGVLNRMGRHALLTAGNSRSWFIQVRHITEKYGLDDPLLVLQQPLPKARWKSTCRAAVTKYWLAQYRGEAENLDSLQHFRYNFFSLSKPHRTITTAGSPHEVTRAATVTLMLSGRYVTCHRARLFNNQNPNGNCRLCAAPPGEPPPAGALPGAVAPPGTLAHQLLYCPALESARHRAMRLCNELLAYSPHLQHLVRHHLQGPPEDALALLLDPSSVPLVIAAAQAHGQSVYLQTHYLSRVFCHGNHVLRMKLLKLKGIL